MLGALCCLPAAVEIRLRPGLVVAWHRKKQKSGGLVGVLGSSQACHKTKNHLWPCHTGLKSMLLEKRVGVLSEALEMKDAQLGEVLAAAHLDPATLQQVRK